MEVERLAVNIPPSYSYAEAPLNGVGNEKIQEVREEESLQINKLEKLLRHLRITCLIHR